MKQLSNLFLASVTATLLQFCSVPPSPTEPDWEILFDGTGLEEWDTYLGPKIEPDVPRDQDWEQSALGLNNDTLGVFSIAELDGQNVLRISGEIWGGISTKREYENYHLQLQFKWGERKWFPREKDKRDSGLLYHGTGPHGEGGGFWLKSQEFQIQEGDCGDYWSVAGAIVDIPVRLNSDSVYQYDPSRSLRTFGPGGEAGNHCKKDPDAEKPYGEWNTLDLYCFRDTSVHVVNGTVTMKLYNSRQLSDGREVPLTKGKVQLQSESAEVFYRNIKIRPIENLPIL